MFRDIITESQNDITNNPISLSEINICAYEDGDLIAYSHPGYELFDSRRDFLKTPGLTGIAVSIMAANDLTIDGKNPRETKRNISVILVDSSDGTPLASRVIIAKLWAFDIYRLFRVDFPLKAKDIFTDRPYKLIFRDECSLKILREVSFRFYDEMSSDGIHVEHWYHATSASIVDVYEKELKSLHTVTDTHFKMRFNLRTTSDSIPLPTPEFEIRVYYPDGNAAVRFCKAIKNDNDHSELTVQTLCYSSPAYSGVHYVEILCMDYPIAGMVFSTDGKTVEGRWSGHELEYLKEYSPIDVAKRFHDLMKDNPPISSDCDA